jgi:hypothetical protein
MIYIELRPHSNEILKVELELRGFPEVTRRSTRGVLGVRVRINYSIFRFRVALLEGDSHHFLASLPELTTPTDRYSEGSLERTTQSRGASPILKHPASSVDRLDAM